MISIHEYSHTCHCACRNNAQRQNKWLVALWATIQSMETPRCTKRGSVNIASIYSNYVYICIIYNMKITYILTCCSSPPEFCHVHFPMTSIIHGIIVATKKTLEHFSLWHASCCSECRGQGLRQSTHSCTYHHETGT